MAATARPRSRRSPARPASPPGRCTATSRPRPICSPRSSAAPPSTRSTPWSRPRPTTATSAPARIDAAVETFARRALRGRRLAWALIAEPVDPAVEAERLVFRRAYRDAFADVIARESPRGELPEQDPATSAAALVGAIGEALVGPVSPTTAARDPESRDRGAAETSAFARSPERNPSMSTLEQRDPVATHEVVNQATPLEGYNTYEADRGPGRGAAPRGRRLGRGRGSARSAPSPARRGRSAGASRRTRTRRS